MASFPIILIHPMRWKHSLFTVTGNGEFIEGVQILYDYLLSEAGDKIQFTFDDPDYIEGDGFEEDFTSAVDNIHE